MDNGSILGALIWFPVWSMIAIGVIVAAILIPFLISTVFKLTLDGIISRVRDSPSRHRRLERSYVARHRRQNGE